MAIKWLFFCRNKRWTDTVTGEVYEPQSLILFDDAGPQWPIAERALSATMDGGRVAVVAGSGVDFDPANAGPLAGVTAITGSAVQSSATDATANRLMRTGAFGWGNSGANINVPGNNANTLDRSGVYRCLGSFTGTPYSNLSQIIHAEQSLGVAAQIAVQTSNGSQGIARRWRNTDGNWSPWASSYDTANIVGTVSQSGGVPTGAVIERGSNANGSYTRWADGTQICWGEYDENGVACTSATGGIFTAAATRTITFPASFAGTVPILSLAASRLSGSWDAHAVWTGRAVGNFNFFPAAFSSRTYDFRMHWSARGRWFT